MTANQTATIAGGARSPRVFGAFSLENAFYLGAALLFAAIAFLARPQNVEGAIAASAIIVVAVIPTALWIRRGASGLPIFPIFALTHIFTFGLPLLQEHPIVMQFPAAAQLTAGLSVAAYLLLATFVWSSVTRRPMRPKRQLLLLRESSADLFFLFALAADVVFEAGLLGAWFSFSPGVYSILRALVIAIDSLSCFILSYRLGGKALGPEKALAFKLLVVALICVNLPGLLMINAMTLIGIAVFGYTLGARRVAWRVASLSIALFALLHLGKGEMRARYWSEENDVGPIQPTSYPSFIAEWVTTSIEAMSLRAQSHEPEGASLLERASLMQVLLYVQTMTPDEVPYLKGESYAIIPGLLVPRLLNPEKGATHEGTYLLDIYYGFQTREATATTTLAFGMVGESYANFGFVGLAGLALTLGTFYGLVERGARAVPVLSFRFLFAIVVLSFAIQSEYTASFYVAGLFQSLVALGLLAALLMRPRVVKEVLVESRL